MLIKSNGGLSSSVIHQQRVALGSHPPDCGDPPSLKIKPFETISAFKTVLPYTAQPFVPYRANKCQNSGCFV